MGDKNLGSFSNDDSFLRRVSKKRHIDNGIVSWEAFKARTDRNETALSYTFQARSLRTDRGLTEYQIAKCLPHGDLPGICKLTFIDLTVTITPPLPPRQEIDVSDNLYGHLHCVTDTPQDELQMEKMATIATRHGVLRPFVPKKKTETYISTARASYVKQLGWFRRFLKLAWEKCCKFLRKLQGKK